MNRTLLKWLLAASLALNLGIVAALAWQGVRGPDSMQATRPVDLPAYLNLSEQQQQQWQRIEAGFLDDLSVNWRAIRSHREALIRYIFAPVPDRTAIDREQARIAALQDAQQRRVIAQLLAERDVLDARQRGALMALLLSRYADEVSEEERLHRD